MRFSEPIRLRDGSETFDPRLDRLKDFDERSRGFAVGESPLAELPIFTKGWSIRRWFDQRQEGACVSFAWHHNAISQPQRALMYAQPTDVVEELAKQRYWDMQRADQWPGGSYAGADPYYEGTSVLAGAKLMGSLGYFHEYRWCFTLQDILRSLSNEGPVVFACDWRENMYWPQDNGYLDISGEVVGGHAFILSSHSVGYKRVTMWNSWGEDWGNRGRAFISYDDLERLLYDSGECCVPVQRAVV